MPTRFLIAPAALLLAVLVLAVYWPGLHGGFFFDDGPSILHLEGVRMDTLSLESLGQAWFSGGAGPSGRPVAQLSFALNHYSSGRFDPFAFKATNLAIHLASGVLVFFLALRLLVSARPDAQPGRRLLCAAAVAAVWLLHPIQLLAVLHVVQRMTSLSALFVLAGLLLHLRGREDGGRAGAAMIALAWVVFWPLSVLSKETGALFPLFALAWELTVRSSARGGLDRFARVFATLAGLALLACIGYAVSPRGQWLWAGYEFRPFSLLERLWTEARVIWFYLGLILAPRLDALGLYHDDFAISTSAVAPWSTLPSLLGLAVLAALVWGLRKKAPLVAFGIAWFLIGHALESTVLPLELAHEHRNYLPLFGVLIAAGWALTFSFEAKAERRTIGVVLAGMALAYFPFVTALRAHQFGDDLRRTQIESQHHRGSARAQHEAAVVMTALPESTAASSPTHSFARTHYERAGALDPAFKWGLLGLIELNCNAQLPAADADVQELARRLRQTHFAPGDRNVLYAVKEAAIAGAACLDRPQVDHLFASAMANPGVSPGVRSMLHSWHADYLWLRARDMRAARAALEQSLALNPSNPSNRLKWAQLLLLSGEQARAMEFLAALRGENLSASERKTLDELLAALRVGGH